MQLLNLRTLSLGLPLGMALSLCVACGGDDDGGSKNGNGGTSSTSGGSSSSGSGNQAGSATNGGSGSGGSGSGVSLPNDKVVGTLSDSELEQLCDDFDKFASTGSFAASTEQFSCLIAGIFAGAFSNPMTDAELQTACQAGYDACKSEPFVPEDSECTKPDPSCTATVSEVKQCLEDSAKAFSEVVAELPTCSELKLDSEEPETGEAMDPPSCVTLRAKCPGLETPTAPTL